MDRLFGFADCLNRQKAEMSGASFVVGDFPPCFYPSVQPAYPNYPGVYPQVPWVTPAFPNTPSGGGWSAVPAEDELEDPVELSGSHIDIDVDETDVDGEILRRALEWISDLDDDEAGAAQIATVALRLAGCV